MSQPPLAPDELVAAGTEREVLEAFLDLYRGIVPRKLAGLGDDEARRSLVASSTTLLGLVQHLACVEREETARHAGHADILREQTDGSTGFD